MHRHFRGHRSSSQRSCLIQIRWEQLVVVHCSPVSELKCLLGEGLHWDAMRQLLWMVDITDRLVIWVDPDSHVVHTRRMPELVGWVQTLSSSDEVLVGLQSGIARFNPFETSSQITWVDRSFPSASDHRLNDGKVDGLGRLWSGSMSLQARGSATGSLAFFTPQEQRWNLIDSGYAIPNGPAFDRECTLMLHSDSARQTVYRMALDPTTGDVGRRRVWRQFTNGDGLPDGMSFDSDGCVWIAHWGVGLIRRYARSGDCILEIQLPTPNVSNVCFGGPSLDRIFVSTAARDDSVHDPLAGRLFEIRGTGIVGFAPWYISL